MPRKCQITGKTTSRGFKYSIRGIAKKKKGIGLKVTGKTKRRFKPNIQKKKIWLPEQRKYVTLKVSASGLRTINKNGMTDVVKTLKKQGVTL